ncbi:MAG: hypothetical protein ACUVX8_01485 [Candidatus Zipacnadales bacterium]
MYNKIWLICHTCKCEFFVDFVRLQQQPQRACPNCGQLFDIRGMGLLVKAIEQFIQAAATVKFRFESDQRLLEIARVIRMGQALATPRRDE